MRKRMNEEYQGILAKLETRIRPYKDSHAKYSSIPETGRDRKEILEQMQHIVAAENSAWKNGFVSGAVYSGDDEHIEFLNKVYAIQSQSNPLHPDVWPSSTKYEAEIVAMTAEMLGAQSSSDSTGADKEIRGVVTSGGTESILLAIKAYRDRAYAVKGVKKPEIVVPSTAHAAFDKAAQYLGVKIIHVPVNENFEADIEATRKAVTRNTIVIAGSAPSFPHGIIDPIEQLSELASQRNIGFHTDACLGGFVLPWAKKLGYDVRPFDFELSGVTSISADTHKYGYAPKGTSVLLYRGSDIRHYQYFTAVDWPGGLYYSPTLAGSRPGALSAACWASMVATGQSGYMHATKKIVQTASAIKSEIRKMSDLFVLGERRMYLGETYHSGLSHLAQMLMSGQVVAESSEATRQTTPRRVVHFITSVLKQVESGYVDLNPKVIPNIMSNNMANRLGNNMGMANQFFTRSGYGV